MIGRKLLLSACLGIAVSLGWVSTALASAEAGVPSPVGNYTFYMYCPSLTVYTLCYQLGLGAGPTDMGLLQLNANHTFSATGETGTWSSSKAKGIRLDWIPGGGCEISTGAVTTYGLNSPTHPGKSWCKGNPGFPIHVDTYEWWAQKESG